MTNRVTLVRAVAAGEAAGRDPDTPVTACPYPTDTLTARAWVQAFTRGRILAGLPTPSEVGELVDETDPEDDPARLVPGEPPPR
jgi:hypothetical protein